MSHVHRQSRDAVLRKHLGFAHDRGSRPTLAENLSLHNALHVINPLHVTKRGPEYKEPDLTWVRFEVSRGVPVGGLRTRVCPKHRIRLLAAISKDKTARVLEEKKAKGGACGSCNIERALARKRRRK